MNESIKEACPFLLFLHMMFIMGWSHLWELDRYSLLVLSSSAVGSCTKDRREHLKTSQEILKSESHGCSLMRSHKTERRNYSVLPGFQWHSNWDQPIKNMTYRLISKESLHAYYLYSGVCYLLMCISSM